ELAEFRYEWRPDGRIAKAYERIGGRELQRSYKYDEFGRPSRVVDSNGASASYEYDAFGSRSSAVDFSGHRMETAHDWTGRLVKLDGVDVRNDARGNLIGWAGPLPATFSYDARGVLRSVERGGEHVQFVSDGIGRIVERRVAEEKTHLWHPLPAGSRHPVAMRDAKGVQRQLVFEGGRTIAAVTADSSTFFLEDGIGSTRLIADRSGSITSTIDYDPFDRPSSSANLSEIYPAARGELYDPSAGVYLEGGLAFEP